MLSNQLKRQWSHCCSRRGRRDDLPLHFSHVRDSYLQVEEQRHVQLSWVALQNLPAELRQESAERKLGRNLYPRDS